MNDHFEAGLKKVPQYHYVKGIMIGQVFQQTPEWFSWCQNGSWEYANLWVMNNCSLNPKMVAITHTTPAKSHFILNWMNIWINIDDINVVECLIKMTCVFEI